MEKSENVVNQKGPLSVGELSDKLKNVYSFCGIIKMSDIDKIRFNESPISFVVYYKDHWLGIFLSSKELDIMDSTHSAFEEPCPEFINFLYNNRVKKIRVNPVLQSKTTNICGYYCLYFVIERNNGKKYNSILQKFTNNLQLNDYIVSRSI